MKYCLDQITLHGVLYSIAVLGRGVDGARGLSRIESVLAGWSWEPPSARDQLHDGDGGKEEICSRCPLSDRCAGLVRFSKITFIAVLYHKCCSLLPFSASHPLLSSPTFSLLPQPSTLSSSQYRIGNYYTVHDLGSTGDDPPPRAQSSHTPETYTP